MNHIWSFLPLGRFNQIQIFYKYIGIFLKKSSLQQSYGNVVRNQASNWKVYN